VWEAALVLSLVVVPFLRLRARMNERDSSSGAPLVSSWTKCARRPNEIEKRSYVCTEVVLQFEARPVRPLRWAAMTLGLLSERASRTSHSIDTSRPKGQWRGRWLVAESLSSILFLSVVLAYASPPDPSWIPGIYDEHDYDDVVGMVTDATGVLNSEATQRVERALVGFVRGTATGRAATRTARQQTIRGPPSDMCNAVVAFLLTPPNAAWRSHIALGYSCCSSSVRCSSALLLSRGHDSSRCLGPARI